MRGCRVKELYECIGQECSSVTLQHRSLCGQSWARVLQHAQPIWQHLDLVFSTFQCSSFLDQLTETEPKVGPLLSSGQRPVRAGIASAQVQPIVQHHPDQESKLLDRTRAEVSVNEGRAQTEISTSLILIKCEEPSVNDWWIPQSAQVQAQL